MLCFYRQPIDNLTPEERDARTVFCMQLAARIRPRDLEEFFSAVGKVSISACNVIVIPAEKSLVFAPGVTCAIFHFILRRWVLHLVQILIFDLSQPPRPMDLAMSFSLMPKPSIRKQIIFVHFQGERCAHDL